ncbi:MAG: hypothetical protein V4734_06605, partial [Terriglobus sp.]
LVVGVNTVVGYTVAHWTIAVNRNTASYAISLVDFALCVLAAVLAWHSLQASTNASGDAIPEDGRRRFMATLGLLLSGLAAIVVLAETLALLTLSPSD